MTPFESAPPSRRGRLGLWAVAVALLALLVFEGALLLGPRAIVYTLTPEELVVTATLSGWDQGRAVPRTQVEGARPVRLTQGWRQAGSGFSDFCQGRWWQEGLGDVWQATTCGPDAVVVPLTGEDRPLVLSPAAREGFVAAVQAGETGAFPAAPAASSGNAWWAWALTGGLIAVTLGVVAAVMARVRLAVGRGQVEVRTLLSRRTWRLKGARVRRAPVPWPVWRLWGVGLPGYQVGLYRLEGQTVRVYLTDRDRAVWVEPAEGRPVVVTPADPDAFVAAALAQGAEPA